MGVEKPWAEMSIEERDAADRKRGFNNEGDRIGGEGVVVGVDPAMDIDSSTMLIFRLTKEDKHILHCLMIKNDHLSYVDTLTKLLREEAARIGELTCRCTTPRHHDDPKMPFYRLVVQWLRSVKWLNGKK